MDKALKWLPLGMIVATIIAAGSVGQFQLGVMAQNISEVEDNSEDNRDDIEAVQRLLIAQQGKNGLDLQRLQIEQATQGDKIDEQGEKLDEVLDLLRQQNRD